MPRSPIVYINGYNDSNRGSQAMYKTVVKEVQRRIGDDFTFASNPINGRIDHILDICGYAYSDKLSWAMRALKRAENLKRHHPNADWTFLPQSFGPFQNNSMRDRYRQLFRDSQIYARGPTAYEHLNQLGGDISAQLSTDMTWLFEPESQQVELMPTDLYIDPARPIIGIGPNMRAHERDKNYLSKLKSVCAAMEKHGQIILIPHEFRRGDRDDRFLCKKLDYPYCPNPLSSGQLKGLIATCSLFIGSRYHGLVGALSCGVPSLAFGWSAKYKDLMAECNCPDLDISSCSTSEAIELAQHALTRLGDISSNILSSHQKRCREVTEMFDLIATKIKSVRSSHVDFSALAPTSSIGIKSHRSSKSKPFEFRRNVHRLEKGLSLVQSNGQSRKFGDDLIKELLKTLNADLTDWESETLLWGINVLDQYFELFPNSVYHSKFKDLRSRYNAQRFYELYRASDRPIPPKRSVFESLVCSRRSIREFSNEKPDRQIIQECVSVALQAPSACNRQSFRLEYYDDRDTVKQITNVPLGAKNIDCPGVFVIIACYEGYSEPRDIKCPIIDASLSGMTLMYALQTEGLSTLPINFPELPGCKSSIRKICQLKPSETVVILLAVGQAASSAKVASSQKRHVENMLVMKP